MVSIVIYDGNNVVIYQPRVGKTAIFERQLTVGVRLVPSNKRLLFRYLCLCQTHGHGFRVIAVKRAYTPKQYYGRPLHETLYEDMANNARNN